MLCFNFLCSLCMNSYIEILWCSTQTMYFTCFKWTIHCLLNGYPELCSDHLYSGLILFLRFFKRLVYLGEAGLGTEEIVSSRLSVEYDAGLDLEIMKSWAELKPKSQACNCHPGVPVCKIFIFLFCLLNFVFVRVCMHTSWGNGRLRENYAPPEQGVCGTPSQGSGVVSWPEPKADA